jgi:hypothetical protein
MPAPTPSTPMVNDFRIEKSRLPIAITLVSGDAMSGELYIQASALHRFQMEDASEIMNAPDAFFPLRLESGETLLVAKAKVRDVLVGPDHAADPDWSLGMPAGVCVTLDGGRTYTGRLLLPDAQGRGRVLDALNRDGNRFVSLHQDDGLVLVNRAQIVHVQHVDDGAA